jgi:polar amino acid transport system substrate-binding protein
MKKLMLVAIAFAALTVAAQAAPVKIATEGGYPPYNFMDDNGKLAGYDVDVSTEICKRAQLECTFITNDWDSIIPNLLAGNYDAIVDDMSITDERKQTISFTKPYFPPDPSNFIGKADRTFDYKNLKGLKIGAQNSTIQAGYLDQNLKANNTILKYDTQDQELADLNAGNLDLVFIDGSVAQETATGSNGTLKSDGPDISIGEGAGIGMRKADTEMIAKFDTALQSMKDDGTLDTIIAKYFPSKKGGPFYKK